MQYEQNDTHLIETAKSNKDYSIKHFHEPDKKYSLICRKHKIVTPKLLEKQLVEWYHNALCHSGETCAELSIAQHFDCKHLQVCSKYKSGQFLKTNKKQKGEITTKGSRKQTLGRIMRRPNRTIPIHAKRRR